MLSAPNPFVYGKISDTDIKSPDIPSLLEEHYAQCAEDLIIASFLNATIAVGDFKDFSDCVCMEIGANHGFGGNNTYLLEKKLGVSAILVEANPALIGDLIKSRPNASIIHAAVVDDDRKVVELYVSNHHEISSLDRGMVESWHNGTVGLETVVRVPAISMNMLFEKHVSTKKILFVSIDVEGLDLRIAKSIDFSKWRPILLQMEPSEHYLPMESERMIDFMKSVGYSLLAKTNVNLIFADRDFLVTSGNGVRECDTPLQAEVKNTDLPETKVPPHELTTNYLVDVASPDLGNTQVVRPVNPMKDWLINADFVTKLLDQVAARGILSLDIFDTALTRHYDSPADVFAEIERRLLASYGNIAKGFASAREQAERIARQRHYAISGAEDITFAEIYQELPVLLPKFSDWGIAADTELAVERDALYPVPDILELTRKLDSIGKSYIFVSDMYLPAAFLQEVLKNAGYEGWTHLFVSSELRATKATGRIWSEIAKILPLANILHVGDDSHSDVRMPAEIGLMTFEYRRAKSERRLGAKLNPAILPFSRLQRQIELASRQQYNAGRDKQAAWYNLGRSMGGIVLGAYLRWLEERVTLHKIDRLFFCARDGYLIKKAWEAAGFDKKLPVETHYLYISRAALNIPYGIQNSSPKQLSQDLLSFLGSASEMTVVNDALARAGLLDCQDLVADAMSTFGSLQQKLVWPGVSEKFEQLLQRHANTVYQHLSPRYEQCIRYLDQEGLLKTGRNAIVDMGWHGSMQRSLRGVVRSAGGIGEIFGFYYGLWPAASSNRYAAGIMESCFSSNFASLQSQAEVHQAVALLEQLHAAPHGSTVGYETDINGGMHPIFRDNPQELKQYENNTRWFQSGTIDSVKDIFGGVDAGSTVKLRDLSRDSAIAALGAVILSPTLNELELLSQMGHCPTFDHEKHEPIILTDMPKNMGQLHLACSSSNWSMGQIKYWWQNADASGKAMLRDFVHAELSFLEDRVLRQFD